MNLIHEKKHTTNSTNRINILPGLLLAFLVALGCNTAALFVPKIGGATLAILTGIILGNTLFKQEKFALGTKFAESKLLEISVVLLGATVTFQTISELGIKGFSFVLLQMFITIICTWFLGKKLRFNQTMTLMMAGGNAVCGSSAIASIAPAIKAKDEEKGQIITLVNLLGTVMMLILPFIGLSLFGDDLISKSALLGGTLQSVGQVVAGASLINSSVVQYAMLFKIIRIMLLAVVVIAFEKIGTQKQAVPAAANISKKKRRTVLPWYVAGFLLFCVVNSLIKLPSAVGDTAHFCSTWLETTALAAIGLRLNLKKFLKEGPRFLLFGVGVGAIQTIAAIILIYFLLIP